MVTVAFGRVLRHDLLNIGRFIDIITDEPDIENL
jgi:hypothetical protein